MKLSPYALLAASLAAGSVAVAGCAVDPSSPADADGDDGEDVSASEDELSVLGKQFVGKFEWHAADSGGFLDIETIDLKADGTYSAKVEATLVNAGVRCMRFPCTLPESGKWNAYKVSGKTKIRLRPSTNRARVYGASLADGELSLSRRGATTTLFRAALLTCANVRCAAGTHCEMKGESGGSIPVCIADPPPPPPPPSPCVKTGCSGQLCAEQHMFTTCEYRAEYACYQTATCERQANGQCGWTQTPELTACLGAN